MTGYEPRWDQDAEDGHQGELFTQWAVDAIRTGASREVKTDRESWRTGNIYIEFQCKISGQWVPSGIDQRHTDADLWAHLIVGPMVLFAPTALVRWVAETHGIPRECMRGSHPTRGRIVPIPKFTATVIWAAKRWATGPIEELPDRDLAAPFGHDNQGLPLAPYGFNKDGRVRLCPGGRRAGAA